MNETHNDMQRNIQNLQKKQEQAQKIEKMQKDTKSSFYIPVILGALPLIVFLAFLYIVYGNGPFEQYAYQITLLLMIMLIISPTTLAGSILIGRKHYHSTQGCSPFYRNFPLIFGSIVQSAEVIGLIVILVMQILDK